MELTRTLSPQEKEDLKRVLSRDQDTVMVMHGNGENRQISFYAANTRVEARVDYPNAG